MKSVTDLCLAAKASLSALSMLSKKDRNDMLNITADALQARYTEILKANDKDIENASGQPPHLIDRLRLTPARISDMAAGLREIVSLDDPLDNVLEKYTTKDGLFVKKVSVPMGVVGIIYEARPNVTADTIGICIKSGNALVLRGSKSAINSNKAIVKVIKDALSDAGYNAEFVQLITDITHKSSDALMKARGLVDVLLPRGSAALINSVVQKSVVPVIETGAGNCHAYVHEKANLDYAIDIILNGKIQRPSVCNSLESILIDEKVVNKFLPKIVLKLNDHMVEVVGDELAQKACNYVKPATEDDFFAEFLSLKISVKTVKDYNEAIECINKYGTHHSEVIITDDDAVAAEFARRVDSAAVYQNVSTRFTDGGCYGMGAEMGISTQKLHVRGPIGVKALTTYRYMVSGNGIIRK